MNTKFKITTAVLSASLIITPLSGLVQNNQNVAKASENSSYSYHDNITPSDIKELEPFFEAINNIPDELLQTGNHNEINAYFAKYNLKTNFYNENIGETKNDLVIIMPRANFWGCFGSLAWLIGTTAIPVAKIGKIKSYINALGGVKKTVQLLWGATFRYEKLKAAGGALAGLGAEILGIKGVADNCLN